MQHLYLLLYGCWSAVDQKFVIKEASEVGEHQLICWFLSLIPTQYGFKLFELLLFLNVVLHLKHVLPLIVKKLRIEDILIHDVLGRLDVVQDALWLIVILFCVHLFWLLRLLLDDWPLSDADTTSLKLRVRLFYERLGMAFLMNTSIGGLSASNRSFFLDRRHIYWKRGTVHVL